MLHALELDGGFQQQRGTTAVCSGNDQRQGGGGALPQHPRPPPLGDLSKLAPSPAEK